MIPRLITMLTHKDRTVGDALAVFDQCKDLPVHYWGFKDVGLPVADMRRLVKEMKAAGKTTMLEVVSYPEDDCLRAVELAVECNFDYLMGTVFYPSVFALLKKSPLKYMPFCGKVSGSPTVLDGTIEEIIAEARRLQEIGVDGVDLLAYRFVGDGERLAWEFIKEIKMPVVIAGSINSFARLDLMKRMCPWGFTIGSAFFERKFVPDGSLRQQIEKVAAYLDR